MALPQGPAPACSIRRQGLSMSTVVRQLQDCKWAGSEALHTYHTQHESGAHLAASCGAWTTAFRVRVCMRRP